MKRKILISSVVDEWVLREVCKGVQKRSCANFEARGEVAVQEQLRWSRAGLLSSQQCEVGPVGTAGGVPTAVVRSAARTRRRWTALLRTSAARWRSRS